MNLRCHGRRWRRQKEVYRWYNYAMYVWKPQKVKQIMTNHKPSLLKYYQIHELREGWMWIISVRVAEWRTKDRNREVNELELYDMRTRRETTVQAATLMSSNWQTLGHQSPAFQEGELNDLCSHCLAGSDWNRVIFTSGNQPVHLASAHTIMHNEQRSMEYLPYLQDSCK